MGSLPCLVAVAWVVVLNAEIHYGAIRHTAHHGIVRIVRHGGEGLICVDSEGDMGAITVNSGVKTLVTQMVEEHLQGCQLVVVTEGRDVDASSLLRTMASRGITSVMVNIGGNHPGTNTTANRINTATKPLHQFRERDLKFSCRAVILLQDQQNTFLGSGALRFLQGIEVWKQPETRVVVVGPPEEARELLLHTTLRNTVHVLYLAPTSSLTSIPPTPVYTIDPHTPTSPSQTSEAPFTASKTRFTASDGLLVVPEGGGDGCATKHAKRTVVDIYSRCLYCRGGTPEARLVDSWDLHTGFLKAVPLFTDQVNDMHGHKLKVVALPFFPFIEFDRDGSVTGATVSPRDSLDLRMLREMASRLNFTFEIRTPEDGEWGALTNDGSWTGMVGEVAREEADLSFCIFSSFVRSQIIQFLRTYAGEPLVMASHKPSLLPQYLALVKPFQPVVWAGVVGVCGVVGVALWMLQRGSHLVSSTRYFSLVESLLQTLGVLLEQPPLRKPGSWTGRVWVLWWSVFSLLALSMYRSSLVAYLSVPQMSVPVDTIQQLVSQRGWTWGIEPGYGLGWEWLRYSNNTGVKIVFAKLEILSLKEQMERVMAGRHAFFTWRNYIKTLLAANYTDHFGYTPVYISRQLYADSGCTWGCRMGAPFFRQLNGLLQRLLENNLVDLWLREIFREATQRSRKEDRSNEDPETSDMNVVLGLYNLQGAFYLYFMGVGFSVIAFLLEKITFLRPCIRSSIRR